jgi:hypothetical protein
MWRIATWSIGGAGPAPDCDGGAIGVEPWFIGAGLAPCLGMAAWWSGEATPRAGFSAAVLCFLSVTVLALGLATLAFEWAGMVMPGIFMGMDWASAELATPKKAIAAHALIEWATGISKPLSVPS